MSEWEENQKTKINEKSGNKQENMIADFKNFEKIKNREENEPKIRKPRGTNQKKIFCEKMKEKKEKKVLEKGEGEENDQKIRKNFGKNEKKMKKNEWKKISRKKRKGK